MTDLARLGFAADTSDLTKTVAALDALVPAAKRAENATAGVTKGINGIAAGITPFRRGVEAAAAGTSGLSRAGLLAGSAMGTVQRAAAGAGVSLDGLVGKVTRVGTTFAQADAHVEAYKASLQGIPAAAGNAGTALDRLGAAANDNINRLQSTPGNIAAQFQDIAVTAAGGMNPLLIALQQGTQLSSAMAGGVGNLLAGFAQLLTPTTILTIALVGLAAAGLQMVDWASLGKSALEALADVMVTIAPYAVGIAAALALIYSPAIIRGIWSLATAFYGLAAGMLATIGIPAAIVLGLAAVVAAANIFRDELTQIFGFDIVKAAKDGINFIVGSFVGAYNTLTKTWSMLPAAIGDAAIGAANATIDAVESMVNGSIQRINKLMAMLPFGIGESMQMGNVDFGNIANPYAGSRAAVGRVAASEMSSARGVDYVGGAVSIIEDGASYLADKLRGIAAGIGGADEAGKAKRGGRDRAARGRTEKTNEELFAEVIEGADKSRRALLDADAQVGVYGESLLRLQYQQQLFNDATDRGVVLTAAMADELNRRAAEMASLAQSTARDEFIEGQQRKHADLMADLERERGEIGLSGVALSAYRIETEMLAEARRQNIMLNEGELASLKQLAAAQAGVQDAVRRTAEAIKFARETVGGFFRDWYEGITSGRNIFSAFADAVISGLSRIADRMLDRAIQQFLDTMFAGPGGGTGGGILGFLTQIATTALGAGAGGKSIGNLPKFAKGGVVDSPTFFSAASGLGQAGEAGPEGILPLKRGSDGSLGVQMHGGAKAGDSTVNVNNTYNLQGALTPADIVRAIREGSEETKRQVKRELMGWMQQIQQDGATV